jgi:excisionase family DNA binding protein
LDEFYQYIEKQEAALRAAQQEGPRATPAGDGDAEPAAAPPAASENAAPESGGGDAAPPPQILPSPIPEVKEGSNVGKPAGGATGSAGAGGAIGAAAFVPPPLPPRPTARVSRYESVLPPDVLRRHAYHTEGGGGGAVDANHTPAPVAPPGVRDHDAPGTRYVLRGGVTVPVPPSPAGAAAAETAPPPLPDIERYIPALREEKPEPRKVTAATGAAAAPPPDPENGSAAGPAAIPDYLPPIVDGEEPPQVADAPARPRGHARRKDLSPPPRLSDGDAAALWDRLPRHIQLLVGMTEPEEEVAQKYYTRGFKETRHQLIERLLDPTLTLEDTARVLGVCPTTVRRYTNRGVLPHHRTVGQQRRFRLSDVLAFLEQTSRGGGAAAAGTERGADDETAPAR